MAEQSQRVVETDARHHRNAEDSHVLPVIPIEKPEGVHVVLVAKREPLRRTVVETRRDNFPKWRGDVPLFVHRNCHHLDLPKILLNNSATCCVTGFGSSTV